MVYCPLDLMITVAHNLTSIHTIQGQQVTLHQVFSFARTNRRKKSLKIIGPYLWNDLPLNIRQSQSLASFKYHLKHYLLQNNPLSCTCTLHLLPFLLIFFITPPPSVLCIQMIVDCLICYTGTIIIYTCIYIPVFRFGIMEHRSLNRGSPSSIRCSIQYCHFSSIVIFIVWRFSANKHMDGWLRPHFACVVRKKHRPYLNKLSFNLLVSVCVLQSYTMATSDG